jgi:error-prone DNA polymerase
MQFLRDIFNAENIVTCKQANNFGNNRRVKIAGVITVRQRPGNGNVVFMTIEDETGIANVVVWQNLSEKYRKEVMGSRLILIEGIVQRADNVVHIIARKLFDRTGELYRLSEQRATLPVSHSDEIIHPVSEQARGSHPRNVRILPKSRDFH